MTQQATDASVHASITVDAPLERAFSVFTEGLDAWWPREHHLRDVDIRTAVLEPRLGGRWYEKSVDDGECDWGQVLAWEPPHRLVLSWQISPEWKPEPEPAKSSEIEVRFTAEGPARTRVDLEHRAFERHGPGGDSMREAVGGPGGWSGGLERYAAAVARG
jgi:uncharacterized protein YndB with AHSA1/START domain